jgi:hypothetical protein
VAIFRRHSLGALAKMEEFIPREERIRIYSEEEARLRSLYSEGFSEEAVWEASLRRLREEYPEAF